MLAKCCRKFISGYDKRIILMTIDILTNNNYLKTAIANLIFDVPNAFVLFVDLDSYNCLGEIVDEIYSRKLWCNHSVCFIGANSILFNVFKKLAPLSTRESLSVFKRKFSSSKLPRLIDSLVFIESVQSLAMMTERQKRCLRGLKTHGEIKSIARGVGCSEGAVYSQITNAGLKLNLNNLSSIKFFVAHNIAMC